MSDGAKKGFRKRRGRWLSRPVALDETVMLALLVGAYLRLQGGHCDLCPATWNLTLVRRDGKKRKGGMFELAKIINGSVKAGEALSLHPEFAARCRSCVGQVAARRQKSRTAAREKRIEVEQTRAAA